MVWRRTRQQVARMRRQSPGQLIAPPTRTYTYTLAVLSALLTPVPILQSWGNWIIQWAFSASFIVLSVYLFWRARTIPNPESGENSVLSTDDHETNLESRRIRLTKKGWLACGLLLTVNVGTAALCFYLDAWRLGIVISIIVIFILLIFFPTT
jgi:hypothetical protein